jgi:malate dehydrogenase (oxaloacetate-decarboxylating)(NADP+)
MTSAAKPSLELLHDASLNESTAFAQAEKQALGIVGLVREVEGPGHAAKPEIVLCRRP